MASNRAAASFYRMNNERTSKIPFVVKARMKQLASNFVSCVKIGYVLVSPNSEVCLTLNPEQSLATCLVNRRCSTFPSRIRLQGCLLSNNVDVFPLVNSRCGSGLDR